MVMMHMWSVDRWRHRWPCPTQACGGQTKWTERRYGATDSRLHGHICARCDTVLRCGHHNAKPAPLQSVGRGLEAGILGGAAPTSPPLRDPGMHLLYMRLCGGDEDLGAFPDPFRRCLHMRLHVLDQRLAEYRRPLCASLRLHRELGPEANDLALDEPREGLGTRDRGTANLSAIAKDPRKAVDPSWKLTDAQAAAQLRRKRAAVSANEVILLALPILCQGVHHFRQLFLRHFRPPHEHGALIDMGLLATWRDACDTADSVGPLATMHLCADMEDTANGEDIR
mmetsp:Transcript_24848/g.70988  ORF Transcript_24848/g.70988 Transcript_24848/m.70988 type:complete len:283 (-) Transcript_24848:313-1161(-)